jgi:molybdopterin-binding protein
MLSARDQFEGAVRSVELGDVMAEVVIQAGQFEIVSAITRGSAQVMGLEGGDRVPHFRRDLLSRAHDPLRVPVRGNDEVIRVGLNNLLAE